MALHMNRTTVYLNEELHHALRLKSAETRHSMSELINEALQMSLSEDLIDIEAFHKRKKEPTVSFENVLQELKKSGKI